MMSDFTKGPWKVEQYPDIGELEIWHLSDDFVHRVCSIECQMPGFNEDEANARLIAAAPALYEALKNLVNEIAIMGDVGWYNEEGGLVRKAQAALALVDGDSQ